MDKNEVLLDSYALQKDLRIRIPKQVLSNMPVTVGTVFDIYLNPVTNEIVLRISDNANKKAHVGKNLTQSK